MKLEDKQRNYELAEKLLSEQNFAAAVIVGALAAFLAAAFYGIIVARWSFSYGFAAAGVGVVVGLSMGFLGRGISTRFAVAATLYTIIGCVLGNLFVKILNLAKGTSTSAIDVLQGSSFSVLAGWSVSGLSLIHLVFWFVAVFAAVFLAKRSLSRAERLAIGLFEARD